MNYENDFKFNIKLLLLIFFFCILDNYKDIIIF